MIKRKQMLAVAVTAALGLTAAACGGDDDATPVTEPPATDAPDTDEDMTDEDMTDEDMTDEMVDGSDLSVGLLFDITGRGDRSFNDAAAAGLDQATAELGITGNESTPTGDGDRAERLQGLIDQGNELIIGVGFLWGDAITAGAEANPDTNFAIIDSVIELDNVASLVFAEQEGSFLVGAAAALKSQTGTVGFIGGVENDLIKRFEAGFAAGAEAVNPDIEILASYITQPPDFTGFADPARGKEIAAGMYEAGADIVYSAAGASGLGAFEAAREAGEPGDVWAIGVDSDQYELVGEDLQPYILTSMLKRVDVAVFETISETAGAGFSGGVKVFDTASDGVGYSTSGGFIDDIVDQLDAFAEQIASGEIEVPVTR
ncbi:MAG: BMP family ABC transporter substrate-binding protein [Ilumatobacter sp.]|jgi:basic membrane protein A|nr:MAG: BMP family ABC transporter substrate-binding protein [Ilumatobacter sp.]